MSIHILPTTQNRSDAALVLGQILASLTAINPKHIQELLEDEEFRYKLETCAMAEALFKIKGMKSTIEPKKVYLLSLADNDGSPSVALVSQEVFDWITTEPEGELLERLQASGSVLDTTTPAEVSEAADTGEEGEATTHGLARITTGSYENDKAIHAMGADLCGGCLDSKGIFAWLRDHPELQLEDTYHGFRY